MHMVKTKRELNTKEKVLFYITLLFAVYNLYEINIVIYNHFNTTNLNPPSPNGYFDLLLPILFILNLIWFIKARNKISVISSLLCLFSIVAAIVMLFQSGPLIGGF